MQHKITLFERQQKILQMYIHNTCTTVTENIQSRDVYTIMNCVHIYKITHQCTRIWWQDKIQC